MAGIGLTGNIRGSFEARVGYKSNFSPVSISFINPKIEGLLTPGAGFGARPQQKGSDLISNNFMLKD